MEEENVDMVADSRLKNLKRMDNIGTKKLNLRIPMESSLEELVKYSDATLISEIETIEKIDKIANKKYDVILMVDLGDLREGIFKEEDVYKVVGKILKLKNINLLGIGNNLSCYGGIKPTVKNLGKFVEIAENIEKKYDIKLEILSGGNSGILSMIDHLPKRINQIRSGAALACGIGLDDERIKGFSDKVFTLEAEVVELQTKPSVPIGESGLDAFGHKPTFKDEGDMVRAICAVGKQDVDIDTIVPYDKNIKILGGSSDHLILNVTNAKGIKVGTHIKFQPEYGAVLSLMTSEFINKETR